jgi:hypothetical protein
MWDDGRKAGILNSFDPAGFANVPGTSGRDNAGALPSIALDLMSKEGLCGGIPRFYRHETESFAWSLISLYFAIAEGKDGKNYTRNPAYPLRYWFTDWDRFHDGQTCASMA